MPEIGSNSGVLDEGDTGFNPDGRVIVVAVTIVNTFPIVEGMYPADSTDADIIERERAAALNDPAAYIEDAEVSATVVVERALVGAAE